jgi:hypothetical protein
MSGRDPDAPIPPDFRCPYAPPGERACPAAICDCFVAEYPDSPFDLHPEAFTVSLPSLGTPVMDPNETLRIIRATIKQMRVEEPTPYREARPEFIQHARDLAAHVEALDEWLTQGGFLPATWQRGGTT